MKQNNFLKRLVVIGLFLLLTLIFSQKIDFVNIDLGRHLENGKVLWQNPQVLWQNFYSYTEPNFKFINHHWLSGVIFYQVYLLGGFKLLSLFNLLLGLLIFYLAFNLAQKKSNFYLSVLTALPVIYLLSERVEIRPELFSYLLFLIVWRLIDKTTGDQKWRRLFWLAPIFIFWVNLHIYFFIGLVVLALKLGGEFLPKFILASGNFKSRFLKAHQETKPWSLALIASSLVCLINPNTWRALIYPFNIFNNYAYEIVENKNIFYLGHLIINPNFVIFKVALLVLFFSWLFYFWQHKKIRLFDLLLSTFFSFLALFASRNLAIFALAALVLIPANLQSYKINLAIFERVKKYLLVTFIIIIYANVIYLYSDSRSLNKVIRNPLGFGLKSGESSSEVFFKDNKLSGPIFNNYDIGSALTFWLYPQEKVFVDNRPEAYSNKFFKEVYIPAQNEVLKWQELNKQYQFKAIYFSHTDGTPWAQQFLSRILNDKDWSLVYFDEATLILLNNKLADKSVISKFKFNERSFRDRLRLLVDSSNIKTKMTLGSLAEKAGQPLLAEEVYRGILMKQSNYNQALIALASLYSGSDPNKSLKYFKAALDNAYQLPEVYNQMGLVNWNLAKYQEAELSWLAALKLDKTNTSALYYLDQVATLRRQGKLPMK